MNRRTHFILWGGGLLLVLTLLWSVWRRNHPWTTAVGAIKVYSYPTFVSALGAGPDLKANFEKTHPRCRVELHNAGDPGLMINRIEKAAIDGADVAIGFDQLQVLDKSFQLPCESLSEDELPGAGEWLTEVRPYQAGCFYPFNWSPMTLITRNPRWGSIKGFEGLKQSELTKGITLQDPRSSTPGMQFLFWLTRPFGKDVSKADTRATSLVEKLRWLSPLIHSLHPNWSQSYGVFQNGYASTTFTFLTSMIYEWEQDPNTNIRPLVFASGHPIQVEYVGVLKSCRNCGCAKAFVGHMFSRNGQKILMKRNYMLPVIRGLEEEPLYRDLPKLPLLGIEEQRNFINQKREWLETWKKFSETL